MPATPEASTTRSCGRCFDPGAAEEATARSIWYPLGYRMLQGLEIHRVERDDPVVVALLEAMAAEAAEAYADWPLGYNHDPGAAHWFEKVLR